jgi:bla regulator protein BlaR1
VTSIPLSPAGWISDSNARQRHWRAVDNILKNAWRLCSAALLLMLVAQSLLLAVRKRRWPRAKLLGRSVLLSADVGPAIVGFLRPYIVIPAWVHSAPPQTQRAVIAHEYGHLEANDPQLLTAALLALVLVPWNLPLWWQLHRLRHAIEVDCDARVIRSGHDAVVYSETLIAVGERQSAYVGAIAAMSESPSLLEQRIKIMLGEPARWWKVSAALLVSLSLAFVGAAAQVSPPNAPSTAAPQAIALDAATLQRYVGHYQYGAHGIQSIRTISLSGSQLISRMSGQAPMAVFAQTPTHFFMKVTDSTFDFLTDGNGPATGVVVHHDGEDFMMPRMDDAVAARFEGKLAARVQANSPYPGSQAALRDFFARIKQGEPPDYAKMAPELAAVAEEQAQRMTSSVSSLGALQSIAFHGVDPSGADTYLVKFANGGLLVHINMDSKGIINGLLLLQSAP